MAEFEDEPLFLTKEIPKGTKVICINPSNREYELEKDKIYTVKCYVIENTEVVLKELNEGSSFFLNRFVVI